MSRKRKSPPASPKAPQADPTCLRCRKRFAVDLKESYDPKAEVCQCVRPVQSSDAKTVDGYGQATMRDVLAWEYAHAVMDVARERR